VIQESLRTNNLLRCLCRCQAWPGAIVAYCPHILAIDQVAVKLCWDHTSARKSSSKGSYHSCMLRKGKPFRKQ
jgi:hypothetical protein